MVLTMRALALFIAVAFLTVIAFMYSGMYDVGADEPHWKPVETAMQLVRTRSIDRHSRDVQVPPLDDPERITKGAGQYAEMCVICHLAPGVTDSPTREGLYPVPPELSRTKFDPPHAFWVVKHGLKMSGMPAWGKSHDDDTIWSIVAFLQRLPSLTPEQYGTMVKSAPADEDMHMPGMPAEAGSDRHNEPMQHGGHN